MKNNILDEIDLSILNQRQAAFDLVHGPRVGDVCLLLDGTTRRFTFDHGDSLQVSGTIDGKVTVGSFYFGRNYLDYSGGLDSAIEKHKFNCIGLTFAPAWFFHHQMAMRDNGVDVQVRVRVYKQLR